MECKDKVKSCIDCDWCKGSTFKTCIRFEATEEGHANTEKCKKTKEFWKHK